MLSTTLAATLLAASASGPSANPLLGAVPANSELILTLGDFAAAEGDPGPWMRVLMDARVRGAVFSAVDGSDFPAEGLDDIGEMLRSLHGAAVGVQRFDDPLVLGALRADERFMRAAKSLALRFEDDLTWSDETILGHRGHRLVDEGNVGLTLVEVDRAILVGIGPNDEIEPRLSEVLANLQAGRTETDVWWEGRDYDRIDGALFEAFLSIDSVAEEDPETAELLGSGQIGYLGLGQGTAKESEMSLVVTTAGSETFGALATAFGRADASLLGLAPPGALGASVLNVDLGQLIQVGLMLSGEASAKEQYEGAMAAGTATLGVDLEEDILGNLTGNVLIVQYPAPDAGLDEADWDSIAEIAPTIAFGLESSEPFFTLLETAESFLGAGGVEVEETDQATLWTTEMMPGTRISAALTDDFLVLGEAARTRELIARAGSGPGGGLLDGGDLAYAGDQLSGAYIGATDMAASWDLALEAAEADTDGVVEVPEFAFTLLQVAREHLRGVGFGDARLTESEFGFRVFVRGQD